MNITKYFFLFLTLQSIAFLSIFSVKNDKDVKNSSKTTNAMPKPNSDLFPGYEKFFSNDERLIFHKDHTTDQSNQNIVEGGMSVASPDLISPILSTFKKTPYVKRRKRKNRPNSNGKNFIEKGPFGYVEDVLDVVLETFINFEEKVANNQILKLIRALIIADPKTEKIIFSGSIQGKKAVKPVDDKTALFLINVLMKFTTIKYNYNGGKILIEFDLDSFNNFINSSNSVISINNVVYNLDSFILKFLKPKNRSVKSIKKRAKELVCFVSKHIRLINSNMTEEYDLNVLISLFYKLEIIYKNLLVSFSRDLVEVLDESDNKDEVPIFSSLGSNDLCKIYDCNNNRHATDRDEFYKQVLRNIIASPFLESFLRLENTMATNINSDEFKCELVKAVANFKELISSELSFCADSYYRRINILTTIIVDIFKKGCGFFDDKEVEEIKVVFYEILNKFYYLLVSSSIFNSKKTGTIFIAHKFINILAPCYRLADCMDNVDEWTEALSNFVVISRNHIMDPIITIKNGKSKIQGGHFLFRNEIIFDSDCYKFNNKYLADENNLIVENNGHKYLIDSFMPLYRSGNLLIGYWVIKNAMSNDIVGYKISTIFILEKREDFFEFISALYEGKKLLIGKNVALAKYSNARFKIAFSDIAKVRDINNPIEISSILTLYPFIYEKLSDYSKIEKITINDPNKSIDIFKDKKIEKFPMLYTGNADSKTLIDEESKIYSCEDIGYSDYYRKQKGTGILYFSENMDWIRFYIPVSEYNFIKMPKRFVPLIEFI